MVSRTRFAFIVVFFCCISPTVTSLYSTSAVCMAQPATADLTEPTELLFDINKPMLMVSIRSRDSLLANLDGLLQRVGREELKQQITPTTIFEDNTHLMNYLTPDKPFGGFWYWNPGKLGFTPDFCIFLPTTDPKGMMEEMQWASRRKEKGKADAKPYFNFDKVPDAEELYEIGGNIFLLVRGDYVYVSNSKDLTLGGLPDPEVITKQLHQRFAIAAQIDLTGIPVNVKQTFLTIFRATSMGQLQQRDEEPTAAYELRRMQGERQMQQLEMLANGVETIRSGIEIDPESADAVIETEIRAVAGTQFAKEIKSGYSQRDLFGPVFNEESILSVNLSGRLQDQTDKTNLNPIKVFENMYREYVGEAETSSNAKAFFTMLVDVMKGPDLNAFLRFDNVGNNEYAFMAGVAIPSGQESAQGLHEILTNMQLPLAEDKGVQIELDVDNHQSISFHRIKTKEIMSENATSFFGAESAIYVGVGQKTIWLSAGGPGAMRTLKSMMDQVAEKQGSGSPNTAMKLNFHLARWFEHPMLKQAAKGFSTAVQSTMTTDNDNINFKIMSKEDTVKMQLFLDSGVVKLMGYGFASSIDDRTNRAKRREEREKKAAEQKAKPAN
jgi:hypothetical protein